MTIKKLGFRLLKIFSIFLGVLLLLAFLINIWFRFYAEKTLEKLVSIESKGKLTLKLKNVSFTYSLNELNLDDIQIESVTDSSSVASYQFKVKNLNIRTKSLWDFARYKKLEIDNFSISEPETIITLLKKKTSSKKEVSLPEEIGQVYDGIRKGLTLLQVKRFETNEGTFSLHNNMIPDSKPITVSHIQLIVDNLKIDSAGVDNKDKFLNSDSVIVRIFNQQFTMPDGKHSLGFSRFRFNSGLRLIEIDSCSFNRLPNDENTSYFNLFFDTLKLVNLDMLKLYQENKVQADSAYCTNPSFTGFLASVAKKDTTNTLTKKISVKKLSEYRDLLFDIKYVGILNAHLNLSKQINDKQTHFKSAKNDFVIYGFRSSDTTTGKLNIDSIKLNLVQNVLYTADSTYAIRFKDIVIRNDQLILDSLQISNEKYSKNAIKRHHSMEKFVLSGVDWAELLFFSRVKAEKATLYRPIVNRRNVLNVDSKAPSNLFALLNSYSEKFSLNELEIINGDLLFQFSATKSVNLENANLLVSVNRSLNATTFATIGKSIRNLNFKKGKFVIGNITMEVNKAQFKGGTEILSIKELHLKEANTKNEATLSKLSVYNPIFDEPNNKIVVGGIRWEKATIDWTASSTTTKKDTAKSPSVEIQNIDGFNLSLNIHKENKSISTFINDLHIDKINRSGKEKPILEGLSLTGKNVRFSEKSTVAAILSFSVKQSNEFNFDDIQFEKNTATDSIYATIPSINVSADINSFLAGNIGGNSITVNNPSIRIWKTGLTVTEATSVVKPFPALDWKKLVVNDMKLYLIQNKDEHRDTLKGQFSITLTNAQTTKDKKGSVQSIKWESDSISLHQELKKSFVSSYVLKASFENIQFNLINKKIEWEGSIKSLDTKEFLFTKNSNNDSLLEIRAKDLGINNLFIREKSIKDLQELISKNKNSQLYSSQISARKNSITGNLYNFQYSAKSQRLSIDSLTVIPVQTREEFAAEHPFQSTYLQVHSGPLVIEKPDINHLISDTTLYIKSISIQRPQISAYRDKNKPFEHGIIKPLPVTMLKSIGMHFKIDTVNVTDGVLRYTERSDKTQDTGTIFLTRISASLYPVSNMLNGPTDTLRLKAESYLMGVAKSTARFRESYSDSLAGFYLSLRMSPTDLTILNPALSPLLSVKLTSGFLDTISLRAVGREYLSLGEMKMFYHKLHVQFLKNGVEKKTLLTSLMTFAANSFVVKTNNKKRKGVIYFPRDREKAIFNYWVKMALSGMASSVGAKHNKKALRQYRRELKARNLPPIEWDNY